MGGVPPGEWPCPEREASESKPAGDWVAEGGSDWRKEAGEEGGAMKGSTMVEGWDRFSETGAATPGAAGGSETRMAWPIRLLCLLEPKHQ